MAFPIRGAAARATVLLECKKRWGRHVFGLLTVDVPSKAHLGPDTRLFIRGSPDAVSGHHVAVLQHLREPLAAATTAVHSAELAVDDADHDRQLRAAAQARAELRRQTGALEPEGGMYVYERLYWKLFYAWKRLRQWAQGRPVRDLEETR
jgi:hypothetical protein